MKVIFWIAAAALLAAPAAAAPPGDWPGQKFHLRPGDLPAPFVSPSTSNPADHVARKPGQTPIAPLGYEVLVFAKGLDHARWMAVAPSGEVFLAQPRIDEVTLLVDGDGDGKADQIVPFATGFDTPHGLALHGGYLYIADLRGIWRVPFSAGQRRAGEELVAVKQKRGAKGSDRAVGRSKRSSPTPCIAGPVKYVHGSSVVIRSAEE